MARRAWKRPEDNPPACPHCGSDTGPAHYKLLEWYCRICKRTFQANVSYVPGAPFVTEQEVRRGS